MRLLLDTNAYSAWKRGAPAALDTVRNAEHVLMSAVVIGELLFGFRNGARFDRNWTELEAFLDRPQVSWLPVSLTTADRFGRIAAALRRAGTPIPANDMWIAAHALESGADLATFDRHFERVEGVALRLLDGAR